MPENMLPVYRAVSDLRYVLRKFLHEAETSTTAAGVTRQQYLLLISIAGMPPNMQPTVGNLAERMVLESNSTTALIDRAEDAKLVRRTQDITNRRFVYVVLTPLGQQVLDRLVASQVRELLTLTPELMHAINSVIANRELLEALEQSGSGYSVDSGELGN